MPLHGQSNQCDYRARAVAENPDRTIPLSAPSVTCPPSLTLFFEARTIGALGIEDKKVLLLGKSCRWQREVLQ
jgi:hypothetical protein